ncbi:hypothetical protein TYRP_004070 [Tyrophagus putrescentiae]|nr:hypothetical protein TYRP_004070 [Tyrophagus putrescentiae]
MKYISRSGVLLNGLALRLLVLLHQLALFGERREDVDDEGEVVVLAANVLRLVALHLRLLVADQHLQVLHLQLHILGGGTLLRWLGRRQLGQSSREDHLLVADQRHQVEVNLPGGVLLHALLNVRPGVRQRLPQLQVAVVAVHEDADQRLGGAGVVDDLLGVEELVEDRLVRQAAPVGEVVRHPLEQKDQSVHWPKEKKWGLVVMKMFRNKRTYLRFSKHSGSRLYSSSTWTPVAPKPRISSVKTPGSDSIRHHSSWPAPEVVIVGRWEVMVV